MVGWLGALRIGTRMKARLKAGEPWENLEAPASEAEAWSREQIAPAVLLYDELRLHGVSDSVQAVQTIVVRSAVP